MVYFIWKKLSMILRCTCATYLLAVTLFYSLGQFYDCQQQFGRVHKIIHIHENMIKVDSLIENDNIREADKGIVSIVSGMRKKVLSTYLKNTSHHALDVRQDLFCLNEKSCLNSNQIYNIWLTWNESIARGLPVRWESMKLFRPVLTQLEMELYLDLIRVFDIVMKAIDVPYFMCGGTLIGSYRYHGFIPWDDDLDVCVDYRNANRIHMELQKLAPVYLLQLSQYRWKFFLSRWYNRRYHKTTENGDNIIWPFLDICFYNTSTSHIWDIDPIFVNMGFIYPKTDVFPLHQRPFWNLWLPAPHNVELFLAKTYQLNYCRPVEHSHKREHINVTSYALNKKYIINIPCHYLKMLYPIVKRIQYLDFTRETLINKFTTIHTITV